MRIVVVVPSAEYQNYAGARIRYYRTARYLRSHDADLELRDIGTFNPAAPDCDILIFSKCHDARSLVGAAIAAQNGVTVGIDVFDDYFSNVADSRMVRFRNWLSQMVRNCHFALCSTNAMAQVVARFQPSLPTHVMNDPAADFRLEQLPQILERKLAEARNGRRLLVAWFGVGDNPYFPVGLADLSAFNSHLLEFTAAGFDVELRILTNARALTARGLSLVERLPVRTQVNEWSEEAEEDLLNRAFLAFLPVGAQPFSAAKSLNRAVTALTAGCQVLSVGYPLYDQLQPLIYRDSVSLIEDLAARPLRLSPDQMQVYREKIESVASADFEASRLAEFLRRVAKESDAPNTLVLIHGHGTNGAAHKMVQAANGLSVKSPYCSTELGFDVVFDWNINGLTMYVSEKSSKRLGQRFQARLGRPKTFFGKKFLELSDSGVDGQPVASELQKRDISLPFQLATYGTSMREIKTRMDTVFGPSRMIVSESSTLPFALTN